MTTAYPNKAVPEWVRLYKFYFKYAPSDEDSQTWATEIRSAIRNLAPGEVSNAIRSLGDRYTSAGCKIKEPAGAEIIAEVRRIRRGESSFVTTPNGVYFYVGGQQHQTTMLDLKKILQRKPDPVEAWNIICTPMCIEQCRELQQFADYNGVPYERYQGASQINAKGIAQAWAKG